MDKSFDGYFDRKTQNIKRKTNENQTCTSFSVPKFKKAFIIHNYMSIMIDCCLMNMKINPKL